MTGSGGNSDFRLPETLNVPRGEAEGNNEVKVASRGQHLGHCFPWGQSLSAYWNFLKCH